MLFLNNPNYQIKNLYPQCNPENEAFLLEAHIGISKDLESIMERMNGIQEVTPRIKDQIKTCFQNESESCVTYVCADEIEDSPCHGGSRTEIRLGYYKGFAYEKNKLFICMDVRPTVFDSKNRLRCELEHTVFHEANHYLGLKVADGGHKSGDAVYQSGEAAKAACMARLLGEASLQDESVPLN